MSDEGEGSRPGSYYPDHAGSKRKRENDDEGTGGSMKQARAGQHVGGHNRPHAGQSAAQPGGKPSLEEIKALIQQREDARRDKRWQEADQLRDQLKDLGVQLHDKDKIWKTAEGHVGVIPAWSGDPSRNTKEGLTSSAIQVFAQAREAARKRKDWDQADQIRNELKAHGVMIYDKEGMSFWRTQQTPDCYGWGFEAALATALGVCTCTFGDVLQEVAGTAE
eukprot:g8498.t1